MKHIFSENFIDNLYAETDKDGEVQRRHVSPMAWLVDDESMRPSPIFLEPLGKNEKLVILRTSGHYEDINL